MVGGRLLALLGASLAGPLLYFLWSSRKKADTQAGEGAPRGGVEPEEAPKVQAEVLKEEEAAEVRAAAPALQSEARREEEGADTAKTGGLKLDSEESPEPPVQREAPPVQRGAPPVQRGAPPVQTEAPPVQRGASPVQRGAPPVQRGAPPVQREAPPVQTEAPPVQTEAPPVQTEAPLVQAEDPPEAQPTTEVQPAESDSDSEATQVLVLGLDGAGKTSLLHCLSTGSPDQRMEPTEGFNAVSITRDGLHIEFLEIGGRDDLRPYWQRYLPKALLLVFVVDASSPQRLPVAKKHLHELLLASRPRLPLMVLANKQDIPSSLGITDVHDALLLSEVGDRQLFLIGTYVRPDEPELSSGVQDARELMIQIACCSR